MSLFDTIICDYPLPLPDFTEEELEDINSGEEGWSDWSEVEWQTKDMGGMLDVYTIEDDGQIYLRPTQWSLVQDEERGEVTAEEGELEKFEKTAEINFYQFFTGKKNDHWIEFKAVVWKGDLKELELVEYKKEDNSDRIKMQKQMQKELKSASLVSKPYKVYRWVVCKPLEIMRLVMGFIIGVTLKIERWLP